MRQKLSKSIIFALSLGILIISFSFAQTDLKSWDTRPLYSDWYATTILEGDVWSINGVKVGRVEDIIVGTNGYIQSVVVRDPNVFKKDQYYEINWALIDFDPNLFGLSIYKTTEEINKLAKTTDPDFIDAGEYSLNHIIGLTVDVADYNEFGIISDILIDNVTNQLSAYLILESNGDQYYSVPWDVNWIEINNVIFPYTSEVIYQVEPFYYL